MTTEEFENDEAMDREFEALLEQHLPAAGPRNRGELIDATVVAVLEDSVLVTYGAKEEVPIDISEFVDPKGQPTVKPGDAVRVVYIGRDDMGNPELSRKQARAAEAQVMLQEAREKRVPVRGTISQVVKGGVIVDVGLPAFMPGSQVDLYRVGDLQALVGQAIEAYVIDLDLKRGRAVLSRRELLQERRDSVRTEFLEKASPGTELTGRVRDVLDFGVFVEFEGAEGLVPRSELSYDRGTHPSELVTPGQEIRVKVLDVSLETGKLTLSRKRLHEDPWGKIRENFPLGATVSGKVVSIQPFGAFVQLQEGITGLIHAKDISWESEQKTPEEHFRIGDTVTCQVTEIDEDKKRLALSLKHLARDPWLDLEEKYPAGSRVKGTVTGLRPFGAFVKLDEFAEGLLHISDLSWEKRHNHPNEVLQEGQQIDVIVLKLDREQRRISLGLKQITDSPFHSFLREHPEGSLVTGKVTRFAPFGAFVELAPAVEGLIHVSQIAEERVDSPERALRAGEEIQVKILSIDEKRGRLSLSRKEALRQVEQENIRQYTRQEDKKDITGGVFGDALQQAMKKKK